MFATFVFLLTAQTLVACGSRAPDTPAAATPATTLTPASASRPIAATLPSTPEPGAFTAFCAAIHIRVIAPPRLMQGAGMCQGNSLFLVPSIAVATGTEFLTVFRYADDPRGQAATGWGDVLESFRSIDAKSGDTAWSADSQPIPQMARGYAGFLGRFTRTDKSGVRYAGALWTGQVGADTVAILFQGSAEQRATLDSDMAQVLRTIDMEAQ